MIIFKVFKSVSPILHDYQNFFFKEILDDVIIRIIYLLIVHLLLLMFLWSYIKTVISTIGKPSELVFNFL